ncbi:MAG TPA: hypothetical protein VF002_06600 [Gaiellaceae bacterium]
MKTPLLQRDPQDDWRQDAWRSGQRGELSTEDPPERLDEIARHPFGWWWRTTLVAVGVLALPLALSAWRYNHGLWGILTWVGLGAAVALIYTTGRVFRARARLYPDGLCARLIRVHDQVEYTVKGSPRIDQSWERREGIRR